MAQKQQREVKDADHVIREYYEGEESGLQGAFRDQLETYSTGDEGGHDRMKDSAKNPDVYRRRCRCGMGVCRYRRGDRGWG